MDLFGGGGALHPPTLSGRITSAHQAGKEGARMRINVAAHREKKKKEKTGKRKAGEKENSLSISERLRAALVLSFREQHGK